MELYALLVAVLSAITYAQEESPPLIVSFTDTSTRKVTVGEHLRFVCNINRDVMFVFTSSVEIIHQPAVGGGEVILTQAAKKIGAEPTLYNVSISRDQNQFSVVFDILKVSDKDDGTLICRVTPDNRKSNDEIKEDKVRILVMRPLDILYMKLNKYDAISQSMVAPVELESGEYTVRCIAEGSNPASTDVNLYLHSNKIDNVTNVTEKMDTDVVKYKTTITAIVHLTVANTNQVFQCIAVSELGDRHSCDLPIKIKTYNADVNCTDGEAYPGKMYPVLTCLVDYEGLDIKSFRYELGNSESIQEGNQNKAFVEVERQQISNTRARVLLKLYKAQEWHFQTNFYLVVEHRDGHITRESVRLREIPARNAGEEPETGRGASRDPNDDSSLLEASLVTLVISLVCAFKVSL